MPCHAVHSSLSPGILLWSLMQSHGWTSCGSKKHLQISNFQNFTFYSNIQNANAYIRTPSWIYDWRPSCESIALEGVWTFRCLLKSIGSFVGCFRKCPPAFAGEKWLCRFPEQMSPIQKPPKGRDSAANKIFCHVGTSAAASNSIFKPKIMF